MFIKNIHKVKGIIMLVKFPECSLPKLQKLKRKLP